jgi:hypothetical protein
LIHLEFGYITNIRSIAHKTADSRELGPRVNRRYGMAGRQRDDLIGMGKKKTVAAHLERVSPLLNKVRKGRVDLAWATCIHDRGPARSPANTRNGQGPAALGALGLSGAWGAPPVALGRFVASGRDAAARSSRHCQRLPSLYRLCPYWLLCTRFHPAGGRPPVTWFSSFSASSLSFFFVGLDCGISRNFRLLFRGCFVH